MKTKNLQHFFDALIAKAFNGRDCSRIFTNDFLPKHQIRTNWFAITGPPCAGKTTVLQALENLGFPVIHEKGRFLIDQQLLQETILKAKIIAHLENPPQKLTILEDGIPESLAYFRTESLDTTSLNHIFDLFRYTCVFYLEALPLMNDPARPHNQEKIDHLGEIKKLVHIEFGYKIINIPVLPVIDRVGLIRGFL